ncbi:dephospho-CoA kinase [Bifidobacterium biavatii]|uniref:Dephospho-CoA kinase n=1 Tax=Bifidobacterium biavatii DSM 23969 TaxID=1437608 RepID=A0A086ZUI5_9BIFI|nr:dephospho-CoA kinase [Bifidobacterium biavatii]KFI50185.1 dephospho-CoA kinase [Bifidobacterium biavatii DSM 23969]
MFTRIGLTGGIAAGKSTVSRRLAELGATVIDYDLLARRVVAPGSVGLSRIVDEFGPAAIGHDGGLDRVWMADHVFGPNAPDGARERLDTIEHPLIYAEAARLDREAVTRVVDDDVRLVVVHDVPLLAEVIGTIPFCFDHIVTVEAPEPVRIARMMGERGMSREQAEGRIRHQSAEATRREIADTVIDSTQPIEQMFDVVDRLYADWTGRE